MNASNKYIRNHTSKPKLDLLLNRIFLCRKVSSLILIEKRQNNPLVTEREIRPSKGFAPKNYVQN